MRNEIRQYVVKWTQNKRLAIFGCWYFVGSGADVLYW